MTCHRTRRQADSAVRGPHRARPRSAVVPSGRRRDSPALGHTLNVRHFVVPLLAALLAVLTLTSSASFRALGCCGATRWPRRPVARNGRSKGRRRETLIAAPVCRLSLRRRNGRLALASRRLSRATDISRRISPGGLWRSSCTSASPTPWTRAGQKEVGDDPRSGRHVGRARVARVHRVRRVDRARGGAINARPLAFAVE